ncbi:hypothetical protein SUDANB15_03272 [Streptomyces sp. enrichment culture]
MNPLWDSMVDVQSRQQALRAYSRAKEYPCGILCDARPEESNRRRRSAGRPGERRQAPAGPESPRGRIRRGARSQPLASHTRYRSGRPAPDRDGSRTGHDPVPTLRDRRCATFRDSGAGRTATPQDRSPAGPFRGSTRRRAPVTLRSPACTLGPRSGAVEGADGPRLAVRRRPPGRRGGGRADHRAAASPDRCPRARAGRCREGPGRAPELFAGPGVLRRPRTGAARNGGAARGRWSRAGAVEPRGGGGATRGR